MARTFPEASLKNINSTREETLLYLNVKERIRKEVKTFRQNSGLEARGK